jgi:hypothetical protein
MDMGVTALHLYEQLSEATDDKSRAKIIAEAFGELEERYPQIKEIVTTPQLRETELRLQKEIKEVEAKLQMEIREVEVRLQLEIRGVEVKLKETELKLQKEIRQLDVKIAEVEVRLTQAMHRQSLWIIGSVGTMIGGIRLLDWFLSHLHSP